MHLSLTILNLPCFPVVSINSYALLWMCKFLLNSVRPIVLSWQIALFIITIQSGITQVCIECHQIYSVETALFVEFLIEHDQTFIAELAIIRIKPSHSLSLWFPRTSWNATGFISCQISIPLMQQWHVQGEVLASPTTDVRTTLFCCLHHRLGITYISCLTPVDVPYPLALISHVAST